MSFQSAVMRVVLGNKTSAMRDRFEQFQSAVMRVVLGNSILTIFSTFTTGFSPLSCG